MIIIYIYDMSNFYRIGVNCKIVHKHTCCSQKTIKTKKHNDDDDIHAPPSGTQPLSYYPCTHSTSRPQGSQAWPPGLAAVVSRLPVLLRPRRPGHPAQEPSRRPFFHKPDTVFALKNEILDARVAKTPTVNEKEIGHFHLIPCEMLVPTSELYGFE